VAEDEPRYADGGVIGGLRVVRLPEVVREQTWDVPLPPSPAFRAALGCGPPPPAGPIVELTFRLCSSWDWINWNRVLFPRWHEARARLSQAALHLRLAARALRGT
jgi:hypothetical protein